jgi:hypothetical protein
MSRFVSFLPKMPAQKIANHLIVINDQHSCHNEPDSLFLMEDVWRKLPANRSGTGRDE